MGRGLINGKVDAVEPCLRDGCEITIAFCTKYVPKPIPTLPSTTVSSSMVRCGKQQGLSQNATRRRGGAAARAGCAVSSYARLRRGGRATSNSVMSCGVVPVWTRSATISPTTGTNLNPWPEKPQASTTWAVPPSGPSTNASSGAEAYIQVAAFTRRPLRWGELAGAVHHLLDLVCVDRAVDGLRRGGHPVVLPVVGELEPAGGPVDHREAVELPVAVGFLQVDGVAWAYAS